LRENTATGAGFTCNIEKKFPLTSIASVTATDLGGFPGHRNVRHLVVGCHEGRIRPMSRVTLAMLVSGNFFRCSQVKPAAQVADFSRKRTPFPEGMP